MSNKYGYRTAQNAEFMARMWGKSLDKRDWFAVKEGSEITEIRIYDVIGWPFIEAEDFLQALDEIKTDNVNLRINSPGGDVFDGTAIYNAIKVHPATFSASIEGLAASMASIIPLAADTISIADNAWYMIHNPWTFMLGDYHDLRKEADLLERMAGVMANTYAQKTGEKSDKIIGWMDDETWFTGEDAVKNGFADSVTETGGKAAKFNAAIFNNTPENIEEIINNRKLSARDAERSLRDAGFSRSVAKAIVARGFGQREAGDKEERVKADEINRIFSF